MPGAFTSFLSTIPDGREGIKATLRIMVMIARKARATPDLRTLAQTLVQGCPENDARCEAATLQAYVQNNVRYVKDIRDVETVQLPLDTLRLKSGDCDDKALLLATLLEAIGYKTRFCALGVSGGEYSHVMTQVLIPGMGWVSLETIPIDGGTQKAPFGWFPPNATCYTLAHV